MLQSRRLKACLLCCDQVMSSAGQGLLALQRSRQQMPQILRPRRQQQMAASCSLMRLVTHRVQLLLGRPLVTPPAQTTPAMACWVCSAKQQRQMSSRMQICHSAALVTCVLKPRVRRP